MRPPYAPCGRFSSAATGTDETFPFIARLKKHGNVSYPGCLFVWKVLSYKLQFADEDTGLRP
jgi:hypothetical protein